MPSVRGRALLLAVIAALAVAVLPMQLGGGLAGRANALVVDGSGLYDCVVVATGQVKCWGDNGSGQLGNGTTDSSLSPVTVSGISTARAASTGGFHSCVLLAGGTVACWGENRVGQLGNGSTSESPTPVSVSGLSGVIAVAAGRDHTCAIVAGGAVKCWGGNATGQLGNGTTSEAHTPVSVSGITGASAIATGMGFTCAIVSGSVKCWGQNTYGSLGNGTKAESHVPVTVTGVTSAIRIAAGESHACAILADGTVRCWGWNYLDQLGSGWEDSSVPVAVDGVADAITISAGYFHTCVGKANGAVVCWGNNREPAVLGGSPLSSRIVTVAGLSAVSIQARAWSTCAVLTTGAAQCWGDNLFGQLGIGLPTSYRTPVSVIGLANAARISAGDGDTCAVLATGAVTCWGANESGQLGNAAPFGSAVPVTVAGISGATAVAVAGQDHACALVTGGAVKCWGNGWNGQLGDGGRQPSPTPVAVSGIAGATVIAARFDTSCALLAGGVVKCWGGVGTSGDAPTPVTVATIPTATDISIGNAFTCVLLSGGTVKCWGRNYDGELGNGSTTDSATPVQVSGVTTARAIAAGDSHACAVLASGSVKCWGANSDGALGNGLTSPSSTPVTVSGITTAAAISAWGASTCARLSSGDVFCWGYNGEGELGDGSGRFTSETPVKVSGISNATALADGGDHSCVVLADGTAKCWGNDYDGQLGNGVKGYSEKPVTVPGVTAYDTYPPLLTSFAAPSSPTTAATLTYSLKFSEAVTGLTAGDFALSGNATGCVVGTPAGSGTSYTVGVTGCNSGTVVLTLKARSVSDAKANAGPALVVAAAPVTTAKAGTPGAPTAVSAVSRSGAAIVKWTASTNAGTSPITGYTVTATPGGATCTTASGTTCTVTGLANGTWYTFIVRATNAVGAGLPSTPSAPVLPLATGVRASGTDVFAMAAAVSRDTFPANCGCLVYIAGSTAWPDALAGAAAAGTVKGPILFVAATGALNSSTAAELTRLKPVKIVVLGGPAAVSDLVLGSLFAYAPSPSAVARYSGPDRFATAVAASKNTFPANCNCTAYIAYAYNYPDALAGAAAAGKVKGPVLLVNNTGALNSATTGELTRLHPSRIVVLGGSGVISDAVYTALRPYAPSITRYSGSDRYATAADVAAHTFASPVAPSTGCGCVVYVANGTDAQGALAGAAAAGTLNGPLLLVSPTTLPASTAAQLARLKPYRIVAIGGTASISASVYTQLVAYATGS